MRFTPIPKFWDLFLSNQDFNHSSIFNLSLANASVATGQASDGNSTNYSDFPSNGSVYNAGALSAENSNIFLHLSHSSSETTIVVSCLIALWILFSCIVFWRVWWKKRKQRMIRQNLHHEFRFHNHYWETRFIKGKTLQES